MPNHVNGRLLLEGPEADIARLHALLINGHKDWFDDETLDFNAILPRPADLPENQMNQWEIQNWGCKWGAIGLEDQSGDTEIDFHFQTPNSAAHGLFAALASQFPTLEGTYCAGDWAMDWGVISIIENGEYEQGEEDELDEKMRITLGMPEEDDEDEDDDEDDQEGEDE